MPIGLDNNYSQRYWLYHQVYENNQFVGKFHIEYNSQNYLTIQPDGNTGIGTTNPDAKLTVAGKIYSREVKVTVDAGADFVFKPNYQLRTLEETGGFIKHNNHLPEIASEKEMLEKG